MKKFINSIVFYFSFSKGERRGIIVLFTLILLFVVSNSLVLPLLKQNGFDKSYFTDAELAKYEAAIDTSTSFKKTENFDFTNSDRSFAENKLNPFPFNPNDLNKEICDNLGFSDKQTKVLLNYISKGGKFYKKEDFKKMFCITETEYNILEAYIQIPEKQNTTLVKSEIKAKPIFVVDINVADTNDLQEVKGIGPAFARRIAKYRELLGGFVKKEQLLEVFGMDSSRYNLIKNGFTVNTDIIRKININTATIQDLKKHPYFDYYTAKAVFNYRSKNGNFKSVSELKKVSLIYDDFFEKISPYLTVN